MSKNYTLPEVVKEIATTIKAEIAAHEASLVAMRKKELERSHGKLAKNETLCPLCAEPEFGCSCLKLSKSEKLAKKTPPDISEKTMHKLKDEYGHDKRGKEKAYATAWSIENKMKKEEMSTSYASQAGVSHGDKGGKAAYGDGPHDQRPAFHQADMGKINGRNDKKSPIGKAPMKKDSMDASGDGGSQSMMMSELCLKCGKKNSLCKCMSKNAEHLDKNDFITGAKHTQGYDAKVSFGPKATHSSGTDSMFATSPKDEPAGYGGSVKGSPAHNSMQHLPTKPAPKPINITKKELEKSSMPSSSASALAPKPEHNTPVAHVNKEMSGFKSIATKAPISSMGRAKASASGSFTTVKAEMSPEYASKVGVTDSKNKASADGRSGSHLSNKFKGSNPGQVNDRHDKDVPKVKKGELSPGKAENYSEEANGGATKKAKEPGVAMPSHSPKSKKPGKLPVPSAKNYSEKANGDVTKMELKTHPDTDIPDKGSGGETRKGPGLKKSALPSVKQPAVVGTAGKQPVGLGGGDANKIAAAPHPDTTAGLADVKGLSPAGQWKGQGLPQLQNKLAAVRGGSSWLKSTHAKAVRVHPEQAAPKSQRFHGALPLQRSEILPKDTNNPGPPVKIMDREGDKPSKKPNLKALSPRPPKTKKAEMPAPTEGLSAMNHNRRMFKV